MTTTSSRGADNGYDHCTDWRPHLEARLTKSENADSEAEHRTLEDACKKNLKTHQRACRVFLPRLLMTHGEDTPEVLQRMADELELLEAERAAELASRDRGPPN